MTTGDRLNWRDYLMGFAEHAARKSKDETKVGAVLVSGRRVLCTAFNGPPQGVDDLPARRERPAKYLWTSHAEENLIATAARQGIIVEGLAVYVTHSPCCACARLMIQAGIETVVIGDGKTSMPQEQFDAAQQMFREAGVHMAGGYAK
jgi:dCMP deaminase